MSSKLELCCECEEPTGRAGRSEDSLYAGDAGPYCEGCWDQLPEEQNEELTRLRAELEEAKREAAAARERESEYREERDSAHILIGKYGSEAEEIVEQRDAALRERNEAVAVREALEFNQQVGSLSDPTGVRAGIRIRALEAERDRLTKALAEVNDNRAKLLGPQLSQGFSDYFSAAPAQPANSGATSQSLAEAGERKYPPQHWIDAMRAKLKANAHKGDHWADDDVQSLIDRVQEELNEVREAIDERKSVGEVERECADAANMVFMVADAYRKQAEAQRARGEG